MTAKNFLVDREVLRFVGLFFVFVLGLTFLIQISWLDEHLIEPYTQLIAAAAGSLLRGIIGNVEVVGTMIRQGNFAVEIRRGCDGVVASILLISACLAYPFSWRNRLTGVLLGYTLIFVLNMLRIVVLFFVGLAGSAQSFQFFHVYVSQFVVIGFTMVFWIFWAGRKATVHP
jgi:exosortase H (IPTLxxWG-CTERM-specific)